MPPTARPLADKVLVIAAMIALVELQRIPGWIVLVIITREFVVTGLRLVAAAEGVVIAASKGGKLKTVFQIVALAMLILKLPGGMVLMWVAMILTVWSGMEYLIDMCCLAKYVTDRQIVKKTQFTVASQAGRIGIELLKRTPAESTIRVDMGNVVFSAQKIPVISKKEEVIGAHFD